MAHVHGSERLSLSYKEFSQRQTVNRNDPNWSWQRKPFASGFPNFFLRKASNFRFRPYFRPKHFDSTDFLSKIGDVSLGLVSIQLATKSTTLLVRRKSEYSDRSLANSAISIRHSCIWREFRGISNQFLKNDFCFPQFYRKSEYSGKGSAKIGYFQRCTILHRWKFTIVSCLEIEVKFQESENATVLVSSCNVYIRSRNFNTCHYIHTQKLNTFPSIIRHFVPSPKNTYHDLHTYCSIQRYRPTTAPCRGFILIAMSNCPLAKSIFLHSIAAKSSLSSLSRYLFSGVTIPVKGDDFGGTADVQYGGIKPFLHAIVALAADCRYTHMQTHWA